LNLLNFAPLRLCAFAKELFFAISFRFDVKYIGCNFTFERAAILLTARTDRATFALTVHGSSAEGRPVKIRRGPATVMATKAAAQSLS
jgi:hypothetical protein